MEFSMVYKEVRNWIYRNARPLDYSRWRYHFENGNLDEVLNALAVYQNEDGGFGHALEADSWNPNSSPIQTFQAIKLLREVGLMDKHHAMIQGVLRYLASDADFEKGAWLNTIQTNNDYPHASWWHNDNENSSHNKYNPTIGLAGFVLCYADKNSGLYKKCESLAQEAVDYLFQANEIDMHVIDCFLYFMECYETVGNIEPFSIDQLKNRLISLINSCITRETDLWATGYICKPSQFFNKPESIFYPGNEDITTFECDYINNTRDIDGVWDIPWGWAEYPQEWTISKNWWRSNAAIMNMLFLKNFNKI